MTPPEERLAPNWPNTPQQAAAWLAAHGAGCWHRADAAQLRRACAAVPDAALADWPTVARWRALAALLTEDAEALPCLEQAHAGHLAACDAAAALLDAHIALALCLVDLGAMKGVETWVAKSLDPAAVAATVADPAAGLWLALGRVARAVFDPAQAAGAGLALAWLQRCLQPLGPPLAPHERLLAGQLLVNAFFARQQFEQFDLIAAAVEVPAVLQAAPPLMQARWHYTFGFACYQVGRHDTAETAWRRALALAREHGHDHIGLMALLALLRLWLDRGRLAEAAALEASIVPRWGAGRPTQMMELQQMRARLLLLRGRPVEAEATLNEALALAEEAGLGAVEQASFRTDQTQVLIALGRADEAAVRLAQLAAAAESRDAAVFRCLHGLLQASLLQHRDADAARSALAAALHDAQTHRYTMFFRLLPALAAEVCELALRWELAPAFVAEVVRSRNLPAPAAADSRWPWLLWLRLLGGFELRLAGQVLPRPSKPQAKPLELLRLLACEPGLSLPMRDAADALWPDADGAAGLKNLESTVMRLRRLLTDDSLVQVHDGVLGLDRRRVSADLLQRRVLVERLQSLAMQPADAMAAQLHECAQLVQRLHAAAAPRGVLLPGAPDAPWLLARRDQADREWQRALAAAQAVLARGVAALGAAAAPVRTLADALAAI